MTALLSWLATYWVHSTLLLGLVWVLTRFALRREALRDTLWKAALVGSLATTTLQLTLVRPLVGRWELPGTAQVASLSGGDNGGDPVPSDMRYRTSPPPDTRHLTPAVGHPTPAPGHPTPVTSFPWTTALPIAWAAIALVLLARLGRRQLRLYRLLRSRRDVTDDRLQAMLAELRRHAGFWRPVRLTSSSHCATPLALGASEICVPRRLFHGLPADEQRAGLAHELAHLARHDPLWQLAAGVIEAGCFFQPLNRVARLRLRETAEHLADDWAVRHTGSALDLARCLATVASWVAPGMPQVPQGTLAMAEGGSPLLRRVERLLAGAGDGARAGPLLRTAAALALLVAVLAAAPAVSRRVPVEPQSPSFSSTLSPSPSPSPSPSGSPSPSPSGSPSPSPSMFGGQDGSSSATRKSEAVLQAQGQGALQALFRLAMTDRDPQIQRDATERLGDFAPADAAPLLRRIAWEHPSSTIRRQAAETLGRLPASIALPLLDEIVARHPDDRVVSQAVESIAGYPGDATLERLLAILKESPNAAARREALDQLSNHAAWLGTNPDPNPNPDKDPNPNYDPGNLDPGNVDPGNLDPGNVDPGNFTADATDPADLGGDPERVPSGAADAALARANARRHAAGSDGAAVRRLAASLEHKPQHDADLVRERAVWALAHMEGERVVQPLIGALQDGDWRVRAYAAWALGEAGDARATTAVRAALEDSHWRVRMHAAYAAGELRDRAAVAGLTRLTSDVRWQVRIAAVENLGRIGDRAAEAPLKRALRDSNAIVRDAAADALAKLRPN
jgi:HEAT repeat protein/beta-lactamase regulating signal transducer with metallopeptidase domain